jgi:hypothetical protein
MQFCPLLFSGAIGGVLYATQVSLLQSTPPRLENGFLTLPENELQRAATGTSPLSVVLG